ncbi:MAG: nucleoside deaminase [Methylovulum sp.]|nr:nucleoside deaminase [Methylovulum sp.]
MHEVFLQQAIDLAVNNAKTGAGGPYGAVITKDNCILAASSNQVTRANDPTAHAEIMAIRLACQKLSNFQLRRCILYSSCEPCPMCLGAIYWARLEKVYFACDRHDAAAANFDDSFIYNEIALPPSERHITMLQISLPDAMRPFTDWTKNSNKEPY